MEIWKPIISLNGFYEASSLGRIRSTRRGIGSRPNPIMKQIVNKSNGRLYVGICINRVQRSRLVSRLVCEAFHGPPPFDQAEADHKDENKFNNQPDNLQWLSREDNMKKHSLSGKARERARSASMKISESVKKYYKEHPERYLHGIKHPMCKHTEKEILQAINDHKSNPDIPLTQIAKRNKVSYHTLYSILRQGGWKSLKF